MFDKLIGYKNYTPKSMRSQCINKQDSKAKIKYHQLHITITTKQMEYFIYT
jgi:hypothetical protein